MFNKSDLRVVWKDSKVFILGFLAALGIIVGSTLSYKAVINPILSTFSVNTVQAADDKDDGKELSYSFYDMSAWLSAYYNAATSPSGYETLKDGGSEYGKKALLTKAAVQGSQNAKDGAWDYATKTWVVRTGGEGGKVGGGGALLGFPDANVIKGGGILGFLSSLTSSTTTDYSFDSLRTGDQYNSLQSYAYYGSSLQLLGIDASMGNGLFGFHPIRLVAGALMWLSYIIVSFIEKIFLLAILILKVTNPFMWFANGFKYVWTSGDSGPLAGLTNVVSTMYRSMASFGWLVMVPIVIASLIIMTIFIGNGRQSPQMDQRRRSKFRYGIIYFLFLSIGVPFLGTAYTAGLDAMSDAFGTGFAANSFSADSVILSTYVDNEKWIENNRMYLPSSSVVVWDKDAGDVTSQSKAAVRQTALAINALNYGAARDAANATDPDSWNYNKEATDTTTNALNVSTLLWRYMMGDTYSPGTWENKVKAYLLEKSEGSNGKAWTDALSTSATELTSREGFKYLGYVDANVTGLKNSGVTIDGEWWKFWSKGEITFGGQPNLFLNKGYADGGDGGITIVDGGRYLTLKSNRAISNDGRAMFGNDNATMSYLEMYNYLNTKFASNKLSVYSTKMLASNLTRESHATVNQVGAGVVHKMLIFFNAGAILMGLAFLAVGYAFGMLIGAFRRYTSVVSSIFMGTLGFQKGMVQAVAGTIMLIVETLGTLVIYEFLKTLYIGVPSIIETAILSTGLTRGNASGSTGLVSSGLLNFRTPSIDGIEFILMVIGLLLSTIILIWLTFVLMKIRQPIINVMDTTFTDLINRLFYGEGNVPADAPKGVNPQSGGMNGSVGSALGGALLGAAQSNIDGIDGDGPQGGIDPDNPDDPNDPNGPNGSGGSDGVHKSGPDAKVASSRATEAIGAMIGSEGKLNRDGTGSATGDGSEKGLLGGMSGGLDKASAIGALTDAAGLSDVVGSAGSDAVSGLNPISTSYEGDSAVSSFMTDDNAQLGDQVSATDNEFDSQGVNGAVGESEAFNVSNAGDLSMSESSSVDGGLTRQDGAEQFMGGSNSVSNVSSMADGLSAMSAMESQSSVMQNSDSNVMSNGSKETSTSTRDDVRSASESTNNQSSVSAMQQSDSRTQQSDSRTSSDHGKEFASGAQKTAEGSVQAAEGASNVTAGAGRVSAGDVGGAFQVAQGAQDTVQGLNKAQEGVSQMGDAVKGMAESSVDGAVNYVSSEMSSASRGGDSNSYAKLSSDTEASNVESNVNNAQGINVSSQNGFSKNVDGSSMVDNSQHGTNVMKDGLSSSGASAMGATSAPVKSGSNIPTMGATSIPVTGGSNIPTPKGDSVGQGHKQLVQNNGSSHVKPNQDKVSSNMKQNQVSQSANPKSSNNVRPISQASSKTQTNNANSSVNKSQAKPLESRSKVASNTPASVSQRQAVGGGGKSGLDVARTAIQRGQQINKQVQQFNASPTGQVLRQAVNSASVGGHMKKEIARTVSASVSPSRQTRQSGATSANDYYYDQVRPQTQTQTRERVSSTNINSREERQKSRSDARIKRTARPS
jgi:hypothetical protein